MLQYSFYVSLETVPLVIYLYLHILKYFLKISKKELYKNEWFGLKATVWFSNFLLQIWTTGSWMEEAGIKWGAQLELPKWQFEVHYKNWYWRYLLAGFLDTEQRNALLECCCHLCVETCTVCLYVACASMYIRVCMFSSASGVTRGGATAKH